MVSLFCRCLAAAVPAAAALLVGLAWRMWPDFCCEVLALAPDHNSDAMPPLCPDVGKDVGQDMLRHGYTVVPDVIGPDARRKLLAYAKSLPWAPYYSGYRFPEVTEVARIVPELWPVLQEVTRQVQDSTNIRVAARDGNFSDSFLALEFLTADGEDHAHSVHFIWHQDFEAFYLSQQTHHYLNMYLAIDKPEPREAGLSVVSMEALRARSPALHDVVLDQSASAWDDDDVGPEQQLFRTHKVYDRFFVQDFRLDRLSCTPRLAEGELLVLRGDTPHKTQTPIRSHRTTLSVRISLPNFTASELLAGGMTKYGRVMARKGAFISEALKAEFGREPFAKMAADVEHSPFAFRRRIMELRLQIKLGYYWRLWLSWVRCYTGRLMGEPFCPMEYD